MIDENCDGAGVRKSLESHAEKLAGENGWDRMVSLRLEKPNYKRCEGQSFISSM